MDQGRAGPRRVRRRSTSTCSSSEDGIDVQPLSIDVTQGIQVTRTSFPIRRVAGRARHGADSGLSRHRRPRQRHAQRSLPVPGQRRSLGRLESRRWCASRLTSPLRTTGRVSVIRGVTATLRGFRPDRRGFTELEDGPLTAGPIDPRFRRPASNRSADPSLSFTFTLPESWQRRHRLPRRRGQPAQPPPADPRMRDLRREQHGFGMSGVQFAFAAARPARSPRSCSTRRPRCRPAAHHVFRAASADVAAPDPGRALPGRDRCQRRHQEPQRRMPSPTS